MAKRINRREAITGVLITGVAAIQADAFSKFGMPVAVTSHDGSAAYQAFAAALRADPQWAQCYYANLSCAVYDSGCKDWAIANEAARRFLKMAFGVVIQEEPHTSAA